MYQSNFKTYKATRFAVDTLNFLINSSNLESLSRVLVKMWDFENRVRRVTFVRFSQVNKFVPSESAFRYKSEYKRKYKIKSASLSRFFSNFVIFGHQFFDSSIDFVCKVYEIEEQLIRGFVIGVHIQKDDFDFFACFYKFLLIHRDEFLIIISFQNSNRVIHSSSLRLSHRKFWKCISSSSNLRRVSLQ